MNVWYVSALDGGHPTGYLAALGLVRSLEQATVRFDPDKVPVIEWSGASQQAATNVAGVLSAAFRPDTFPWSDRPELRSTTPSWSAVKELSQATWNDPFVDDALSTLDIGSFKKVSSDPQVLAASLMLISGRSYLRKSCADLWPVPPGVDLDLAYAHQQARLEEDVELLLAGLRPSTMANTMSLRYTATDASPRLRSGVEAGRATPVVELLTLRGLTGLLPRQLDGEGHPGLRWSLNPIPLTFRAAADLHEAGACPSTWPRFSARVRTVGGGTKAGHFTDIHQKD